MKDLKSKLEETSQFLKSKGFETTDLAIVLGSGLGAFVEQVRVIKSVSFSEIPNFLPTTVPGHQGKLIFAQCGSKKIIVMQGRVHFYEGHSMDEVVFPVRTLGFMGVKKVLLTNAAGGLDTNMKPGDLMLIEDHINFLGTNPLIGKNHEFLGPRFPDMTEAWNLDLRKKLEIILKKSGHRFHKGIYAGLTGPTYETPSEVHYLRSTGCSATGMSTVAECIAAHHMGMKVAGISCISNLASGLSSTKITHDEVTETTKKVEVAFSKIVSEFVEMA